MLSLNFYELQCTDIRGRPFSFQSLRGKVVIVVNVASLCGFAPQYVELERLYDKFAGRVVVLAFPCNQFGRQEPLNGVALERDIRLRFGLKFPIMQKVEVNGAHAHAVYKFLKRERAGFLGFEGVQWNFEKFVVSSSGEVVARYLTTQPPAAFEQHIAALVKES